MWQFVLGLFGALAVQVLTEEYRRWRKRSRLEVTFRNEKPWCREVTDERGTGHWFRLKVMNAGPAPATGLEAKLTEIRQCGKALDDWDPCVVRWGEYQKSPITINPGEYEYVNLMVSRPEENGRAAEFDFQVVVENATARGFCFRKPVAEYELRVFLHGENAGPHELRLNVQPGQSFTDVQATLTDVGQPCVRQRLRIWWQRRSSKPASPPIRVP